MSDTNKTDLFARTTAFIALGISAYSAYLAYQSEARNNEQNSPAIYGITERTSPRDIIINTTIDNRSPGQIRVLSASIEDPPQVLLVGDIAGKTDISPEHRSSSRASTIYVLKTNKKQPIRLNVDIKSRESANFRLWAVIPDDEAAPKSIYLRLKVEIEYGGDPDRRSILWLRTQA